MKYLRLLKDISFNKNKFCNRNNSAWNQRFFVISQSSGWTKEVVRSEVNYAMDKIKKVVKNESSWNYLRVSILVCPFMDKGPGF